MTEPLTLTFEVACSPELAFDLWTKRISTWWPSDHTVSGRDDLTIVLEAGVGGRIFERTPTGDELEWGEVTEWDPPHHLSYLWHLRADRRDATYVSVRFVRTEPDGTAVHIEHDGWERLGSRAGERRERNLGGWQSLVPHFVAAVSTREKRGST